MNRALAKNPNDRYQTCREMALDFFLALGMTAEAETIIETLPPDNPRRTGNIVKPKGKETSAKRTPLWIGAGIFVVVCLLAVGFGAFRMLSNRSATPDPNGTADPVNTEPVIASTPSEISNLPSAEDMVEITAGTYEVGLNPADEWHSAPMNITLDNFWIDKYQVTNTKYQQYIDAQGVPAPEIWPGKGDHPVRGVTWDQAVAYCSWLNKRLPTEAEWEAAGRGSGAGPQLYPWGNDATAEGKINTIPNQDTYAVGSLTFNESAFGLFDMVGNVWEWVGEPYASVPAGTQILRGGRFGNPQDLAYRYPVAPNDARYVKFSGFRCATDQAR